MSDIKKYQSKFGATKDITGTQYIAEVLIERNAIKNRVKLPDRFWLDIAWKKWTLEYLKQKRQADVLIKVGYSIEAILAGIKKHAWVYSLFNKQLEIAIHEEQRIINTFIY